MVRVRVCSGCDQPHRERYVILCRKCNRWYCRSTIRKHKNCPPVQNNSLPSSNRQDPALVKPQSQFDSGRKLYTEIPPLVGLRRDGPAWQFNTKEFRDFQRHAGCLTDDAQHEAAERWKTVHKMLTFEEQRLIAQAWSTLLSVERKEARSSTVLTLETTSTFDRICDKIVNIRQMELLPSETHIG